MQQVLHEMVTVFGECRLYDALNHYGMYSPKLRLESCANFIVRQAVIELHCNQQNRVMLITSVKAESIASGERRAKT